MTTPTKPDTVPCAQCAKRRFRVAEEVTGGQHPRPWGAVRGDGTRPVRHFILVLDGAQVGVVWRLRSPISGG